MKADIYTRGGDAGQTSLLGGVRVDKDDLRVDAYGTLDEMTSCLGVARTAVQDDDLCREIIELQGELIPLMSEVATANAAGAASRPTVSAAQIERLERLIDHYDTQWIHTGQFVRPGGAPGSAALDLARAICRRAERRLVTLGRVEPVNPALLKYVNRLSDLLYVFARVDEQSAIRATAKALIAGAAPVAQDGAMPLSLTETEAMIRRGMSRAAAIGVPMVLAVVDANGDLIAMKRMDGGLIISVTLAPHKAYTAAIVRLPTEQLAAAAQPGQSLFGIDVNMPKMTLVGGGLPVVKNGVVVGAVGVSGGSVAQDVDVAKAMLG